MLQPPSPAPPWDGVFVALEGIDGAGTSTQARLLEAALRAEGVDLLCTREPSDRPVGRYIRRLLGDAEAQRPDPRSLALLFAADRRDHLDQEILPALRRGALVLSDRYLLSSLAYQGCELDDLDWVTSLNRSAPAPDRTWLLDLPVAEAAARRRGRAEQDRYEVDPFLERVAAAYRARAADPGTRLVDARAPAEDIARRILADLRSLLHARRGGRAQPAQP